MNPVVHFELPANDRVRMAGFYNHVFGWRTNILGEEMENYVAVTTTESDDAGRPKNPGMINGGFYLRTPDSRAQYPSIIIAVEDLFGFVEKIKNAGGEVLGEPQEVPGIGFFVSFLDTEGNRVSILETKM